MPLLLFSIFAVYWSAWDIALGEWTGLIPSAVVTLLLLRTATRGKRGGAE